MGGFEHQAYPRGWGFGGGHLLGLIWMIAVLGLLIYLAVMIIRRINPDRHPRVTARGEPATLAVPTAPLEAAQMRYARGEITRDQYEVMRQDLQQ